MSVTMNKRNLDLTIVDLSAQKCRREIGKNCCGGNCGGGKSEGG
jgi:hypothetical protein